MSEIRVKTIKGLGTAGIKIPNPVGVDNINAPSNGIHGVHVNGVLSVVNSGAQVVTVEAEKFGVKIKAPPQGSNSILRFSDKDGNDRAGIIASPARELFFESQGITGMVMNTQGLVETKYSAQFNNKSTIAGISTFEGQSFYSLTPKCSGVPTANDDLVNLEFLKLWYLFSTDRVKLWSVFGTADNGGIAIGRVPSGKHKGKCCCGCGTFAGSRNTGVYNTVLTGKWTIIAFGYGIRSCSCGDIEGFFYPIDDSAVWDIENDSIRNTITNPLKLPSSGIYNVFGFAIKKYPGI